MLFSNLIILTDMTRPLRWTEPGFIHHVTNRGLSRMAIYQHDDDRLFFLGRVDDCGPRWGVWALVYCLVDNHYHLVLLDETGQLSRAMRHIDGVYTQYYNRGVR
jgi:hypothetical protein